MSDGWYPRHFREFVRFGLVMAITAAIRATKPVHIAVE